MPLARLQELLDLHGGDVARFPEDERAAASALLADDAHARRMLADAAALEQALSALNAPEPSAALRRAVAEIPLRHPHGEGARAVFAWLPLRSAWALCASAALIVALGALSGALADDLDLSLWPAPASEFAGEDEDAALSELSELAFAGELDDELAP
jgi:hypothetical protein